VTQADPSIVRLAHPDDADALVALCSIDHAENALRDGTGTPFPFSETKVRGLLQMAFQENVERSFCGVIGTVGKPEATVYLKRDCIWSSDRPILREVFSIVAPPYRKTNHARDLTAFSKVIAACLEKTLVAEITAQRIEAKERFYARNYGAERIGSFYAFDPMPGA